jgi:hypothetical protein
VRLNPGGRVSTRSEGTPQGEPLSPLLSIRSSEFRDYPHSCSLHPSDEPLNQHAEMRGRTSSWRPEWKSYTRSTVPVTRGARFRTTRVQNLGKFLNHTCIMVSLNPRGFYPSRPLKLIQIWGMDTCVLARIAIRKAFHLPNPMRQVETCGKYHRLKNEPLGRIVVSLDRKCLGAGC